MMLLKCCAHFASKFGKLSNGHKTGKGQFSFQPKERQCQKMLKLPHIFKIYTCVNYYLNDTRNFNNWDGLWENKVSDWSNNCVVECFLTVSVIPYTTVLSFWGLCGAFSAWLMLASDGIIPSVYSICS